MHAALSVCRSGVQKWHGNLPKSARGRPLLDSALLLHHSRPYAMDSLGVHSPLIRRYSVFPVQTVDCPNFPYSAPISYRADHLLLQWPHRGAPYLCTDSAAARHHLRPHCTAGLSGAVAYAGGGRDVAGGSGAPGSAEGVPGAAPRAEGARKQAPACRSAQLCEGAHVLVFSLTPVLSSSPRCHLLPNSAEFLSNFMYLRQLRPSKRCSSRQLVLQHSNSRPQLI